jgi:hypothetical protein
MKNLELDNLPNDNEFSNGIGDFFENVKDTIQTEFTDLKEAADLEDPDFKTLANKVMRFELGTASIRNSFRGLLSLNFLGFSRRLYPALLSQSQLQAKGMDINNAKRAKKALYQLDNLWTTIGGNTEKLHEAIVKGWNRKPLSVAAAKEMKAGIDGMISGEALHEGEFPYYADKIEFLNPCEDLTLYSFANGDEKCMSATGESYSGAEGYTVATWISLAISLIGMVLKILQQNQVNKNPYQAGQAPDGDVGSNYQSTMQVPADAPQYDAATNRIIDPTTGEPMDASGQWLGIDKKYWYIGSAILGVGLLTAGIIFLVKKAKK